MCHAFGNSPCWIAPHGFQNNLPLFIASLLDVTQFLPIESRGMIMYGVDTLIAKPMRFSQGFAAHNIMQ